MDRFKARGTAPTRFRIATSAKEAPAPKVDREANVLRGVSAIARGPALGHGMFVDALMVSQVVEAGNAAKGGVKARFTHPGMSSDGLGTLLGRAENFRVESGKALADLYIVKSAFTSPKGDIATYAMDLAEESPDKAGFSIVFSRDLDAEAAFIAENSMAQGDDSIFLSPDEKNVRNYPHVRLSELHDVDLVDDAAANEDGMFSAPDFLLQAQDVVRYALGLTEEKPLETFAGLDPERIRRFCVETLAREHCIIAFEGENPMEEESIMDSKKEKDVALSGDSPPDKALEERERAARIRELAKDCDQVELGNQLIDDGTDAVYAGQKILAAQGRAIAELAKMKDPAESLKGIPSPGADGEPSRVEPTIEHDSYGSPKVEAVEAYHKAHPELTFNQAAMALAGPDQVDRGKVR